MDHRVIDLDDYNDGLGESDKRPCGLGPIRRATSFYLVGSFALGVALGGLGLAELQDPPDQRTQADAVALVAIAGPASNGGTLAAGSRQWLLAVINTGPRPVTVRTIGAEIPGFAVEGPNEPRQLQPGSMDWIDAKVTIDCSVDLGPGPLRMRFSVQTVDQQVRETTYPVAFSGTSWQERTIQSCPDKPVVSFWQDTPEG